MTADVDPAARIIALAAGAGLHLATAESLTAGAVVARLVDVPGASSCVVGGAACYSYDAKHRVLGVDEAELARTGAVTASIARQMALGALELYAADLAVSTTGVAGPGADERGVPAGSVRLALAGRTPEGPVVLEECELHERGSRREVRRVSVEAALSLLQRHLDTTVVSLGTRD
ncbi:damage-inducible protein CinA [Brachybacterium endophyticum]|uniref:Damage-inducible protein CinA n=1 Tax=Brachybacterium endophyticum TaxID=2182385 RepID=A0A2U2RLQ0_9MICO|nr:nicotinamide-nucleotide amidohydrolase family protein [Brachybacterium endophyticum]PWH06761.1 damage-inducible protein CinA [Brachybacterium endophyticum]